jgi:hypothetical protein
LRGFFGKKPLSEQTTEGFERLGDMYRRGVTRVIMTPHFAESTKSRNRLLVVLRHRLCPDLTETVLATGSRIERTLPGLHQGQFFFDLFGI